MTAPEPENPSRTPEQIIRDRKHGELVDYFAGWPLEQLQELRISVIGKEEHLETERVAMSDYPEGGAGAGAVPPTRIPDSSRPTPGDLATILVRALDDGPPVTIGWGEALALLAQLIDVLSVPF
jgi:hypothetical protein